MSDQLPIADQAEPITDVRDIVRQTVEEFIRGEQRRAEPAYKTELQEERKRRENLESRLNQLVEENRKARSMAEESDRNSQIKTELQRLGVAKVDLAFRAVKDEIVRSEDGRLLARGSDGKSMQDYLTSFVQENPELLPARISGGSGAQTPVRSTAPTSALDIDMIKPGMSKEEMQQVREEISRLAKQSLRGL